MDESKRLKVYGVICLALVIVAVVSWMNYKPAAKPPPSSSGYYYGPLRSKGDRNVYGTENGVRVAPPAGAGAPSGAAGADTPPAGAGSE